MAVVSGSCSFLIGLLFGASPWLILLVGLVWGFTAVANSARFSMLVTEYADLAYVGMALALQLAAWFTVTVVTIWLIPLLQQTLGWRWAFAILVPGPSLGVVTMLRLKLGRGPIVSHLPLDFKGATATGLPGIFPTLDAVVLMERDRIVPGGDQGYGCWLPTRDALSHHLRIGIHPGHAIQISLV